MATRRLDLLLKEIGDPYVQENFYKLKQYLDAFDVTLLQGSPGPQGPPGISGSTTSAPKIVINFATDAGTLAGHLVRINAVNTVTRITNNLTATIPNGIFGVGLTKPSSLEINVVFVGVVGGYVGLTTGSALFISTAGVPTHTPPATGMVQQIGFAVSTTEILVDIKQAMRRS